MVQTRRQSLGAVAHASGGASGGGGGGGGAAVHPAPEPFHVGFAISTWQNSGDQSKEASNWGMFERRRSWLGLPTIWGGHKCGQSCDFWNRYEEDLERAASLGSNCFRLSLEWHRLEPERGRWDEAAVQRFVEILECCRSKGLEPHVTLHHFVHPAWFERLGGFTKEENIAYFLDYAGEAFRRFGRLAKYWATFNEPGVTSFAGHIYGSFPPGRVGRVAGCARQMLHMLRAHTAAYDLIKALPGGRGAQVGIVWNYFWFEPKRGRWTPPYLPWISRVLTRVWGNDVFVRYLQTGEFEWDPLPWLFSRVHYREPGGRPGCDFIGLNYYSRGVMDWKLSPSCNAGERMTDMPYALYPEGLLLAIHHLSAVSVPIYITETGVADRGDALRAEMIDGYMAQVERAVGLGYDLRGVMYWSLVDNFEWAFGFSMRFGVYRWENDGSQERKPHASAALLKRWYQRLPGRVAELLRRVPRRVPAGLEDGAGEEEAAAAPLLQPAAA